MRDYGSRKAIFRAITVKDLPKTIEHKSERINMLLDILNFIFVYFFSGLILSAAIHRFFKERNDIKCHLLLGFGVAPLSIALILYYLYAIFPHEGWVFYYSIIYGSFSLLAFVFLGKISNYLRQAVKNALSSMAAAVSESSFRSKSICLFVVLIVLFTFIRGTLYPNTWIDSLLYLRQGYVYSHDRSLYRLGTNKPFSDFGTNKIAPPKEPYIMDTAIRPALPILYSFFFRNQNISTFQYLSIRFLYFYYFIFAILILYYYLRKYFSDPLIGILAFVSCYYVLVFGPIFNAKEIIILFLSFFSFMLISEIDSFDDTLKHRYAAAIGTMIGLSILINLSGIIIGGILFLVLFKEIGLKKKGWPVLLLVGIVILACSGSEMKNLFTFILNPKLFNHNTTQTFKSPEVAHYKLIKTKLDILLKGKLQGITQIQFYGPIFIIFLITLFRSLQNRPLDAISKNILLYMGLFFFIVMDPFFLNPQKYAYVLSISPKYTVLLTIFTAFFIARHYEKLINVKEIKTNRVVYSTLKYFIFGLSVLMLLPWIRTYLSHGMYMLFYRIMPIYNSPQYYMHILNKLLTCISILFILIILIIEITTRFTKNNPITLSNQISSLVIVAFIIPVTFLLNTNYNVYNIVTNVINSNVSEKLCLATVNPQAKQLYRIIAYINKNIGKNKNILIELPPTNLYSNIWYLVRNNRRLVEDESGSVRNLKKINYLLISKQRLNDFTISPNYSKILETSLYVLYKIT